MQRDRGAARRRRGHPPPSRPGFRPSPGSVFRPRRRPRSAASAASSSTVPSRRARRLHVAPACTLRRFRVRMIAAWSSGFRQRPIGRDTSCSIVATDLPGHRHRSPVERPGTPSSRTRCPSSRPSSSPDERSVAAIVAASLVLAGCGGAAGPSASSAIADRPRLRHRRARRFPPRPAPSTATATPAAASPSRVARDRPSLAGYRQQGRRVRRMRATADSSTSACGMPSHSRRPSDAGSRGQTCQLHFEIYAPTSGGPWPLIVLEPGGNIAPGDPGDYLDQMATALAGRGAVVMVGQWRQSSRMGRSVARLVRGRRMRHRRRSPNRAGLRGEPRPGRSRRSLHVDATCGGGRADSARHSLPRRGRATRRPVPSVPMRGRTWLVRATRSPRPRRTTASSRHSSAGPGRQIRQPGPPGIRSHWRPIAPSPPPTSRSCSSRAARTVVPPTRGRSRPPSRPAATTAGSSRSRQPITSGPPSRRSRSRRSSTWRPRSSGGQSGWRAGPGGPRGGSMTRTTAPANVCLAAPSSCDGRFVRPFRRRTLAGRCAMAPTH